MHIPDGFINGAASAGFGAVAAGGVGLSVRQTGRYLSDRQVPLAGLVAAFVFAAQMVNFAVLPGMSGHLLGGVMAAVLVGPWAALLVLAVVLGVQGLVFADGGLSALGLNVVNMGIIGAVGGYLLYRVLLRVLRRLPGSVAPAAGLAAAVSVPLAAMGFAVEYALGGTASVALGTVVATLLWTHVLIGIGEGVLTAMVVAAVMRSRPDIVYGAPTYEGERLEALV
jgi:cobalt/nickel transport system permease protein